MRLSLAVTVFATLALQSLAPLQTQGPAHAAEPSSHPAQAGRAFWGIPAVPPPRTASLPHDSLPHVSLPHDSLPHVSLAVEPLLSEVELAYYHGAASSHAAGPRRSDPPWENRPLGGDRYRASSPKSAVCPKSMDAPEWMGEDLGLPAPVVGPVVGSVVGPVRAAPFPYGYFGASGTRHWQRHFGFRQAYTQWTLK